jgi:hypothetical protein
MCVYIYALPSAFESYLKIPPHTHTHTTHAHNSLDKATNNEDASHQLVVPESCDSIRSTYRTQIGYRSQSPELFVGYFRMLCLPKPPSKHVPSLINKRSFRKSSSPQPPAMPSAILACHSIAVLLRQDQVNVASLVRAMFRSTVQTLCDLPRQCRPPMPFHLAMFMPMIGCQDLVNINELREYVGGVVGALDLLDVDSLLDDRHPEPTSIGHARPRGARPLLPLLANDEPESTTIVVDQHRSHIPCRMSIASIAPFKDA